MSFGYDRMAKKHTCNQPNYSIGAHSQSQILGLRLIVVVW